MHLPQIAALSNVTDGPAELARPTQPAPGRDVFGAVFSKEAAAHGPARASNGRDAERAASGQGADPRDMYATPAGEPANAAQARDGAAKRIQGPGAAEGGSAPADARTAEPRGQGGAVPAEISVDVAAEGSGAPVQTPGEAPATGAEVEAGRATDAAALTEALTAEAAQADGLASAAVQAPTPVSPGADARSVDRSFAPSQFAPSQGAGPVAAGLVTPAHGPASGSHNGLAEAPGPDGRAPDGQRPGAQVSGTPAGAGSLSAGLPRHGAMTLAAGAEPGADRPGQPAGGVPAGADAGAAFAGATPTGRGPGAGLQTAGLPGMADAGQMETGATAPRAARPGAEGEAIASARPAAGPQSDGTTPAGATGAGATGLASGGPAAPAYQMQQGAAPGASDTRGPRAEGRAAEIAHAATTAAGQSDTGSQPAAGPKTGHDILAHGRTRAGTPAAAGGAGAPAQAAGEGLFGADPQAGEFAPGEGRGVGRSAGGDMAVLPTSVQTPRQVTLQIAQMVRASGERAVELRLQPEELGRVQMTMSQDATGTLTVALTVERAETLDLLRRNIDQLGADLRELGYENVDFSFRGDGQGAGTDHDGPRGAVPPGAQEPDAAAPRASGRAAAGHATHRAGDGIDIRL